MRQSTVKLGAGILFGIVAVQSAEGSYTEPIKKGDTFETVATRVCLSKILGANRN